VKLVSLPAPTPDTASTLLAGTVLRARSGFYTVRTDAARDLECRLRGRVKQERGDSAGGVFHFIDLTAADAGDGQGLRAAGDQFECAARRHRFEIGQDAVALPLTDVPDRAVELRPGWPLQAV